MNQHVPAHLWGKSLDYLFYDEVERLACVSKFFRLEVLSTASRVNFRTIDSLVQEVSHNHHFRHCCVTELFIANFFSIAAHTYDHGSFCLTGGISDGSRALSSVCAYQHMLAPGMPNKVILGNSWEYEVTENEETGLSTVIAMDATRHGVVGSNVRSLRLYPVDWSDEHEPNTFMPECVKYEHFIIQLTTAYESSLLSGDIIFEGIPFWHGIHAHHRLKCICSFCEGVNSFFPVSQRTGKCERVTPGFFPFGFNNEGFNKYEEDSYSEYEEDLYLE